VTSLTAKIWAAWQGKKSTKDSALVKLLNADNQKLQGLAKQRDALASKIAAARKYATDITASARQEASLGQLGIEEGTVSAGSIKAGLAAKLAKIKSFTNYIGMLAKRGLSKSLLRQILDMGPEQGYAYASALAGASSSTLKAINATQSSIDKATTTLGRNGADILYDSGKQAGKGFLTGLQSQQDAIENQMLKIAKGMQKAIRKALGIKSPSRVMAGEGRHTTEGVAVGMIEGLPAIDRAIGVVTGRIAGARPVMGRPAVLGGAGGQTINVSIDARGAMDPVAVGRELQRVLVQFGRAQGSTVSLRVG
jgi:trimeric autotransporter adhesin